MQIFEMLLTVICSVFASGGFWAWWSHKADKKDLRTKLLLEICRDRILTLGMTFIYRGYLTQRNMSILFII